ncbi:DUF5590 domain-containing protein [Paenibacillus sp. ACRRX]|uniref:cell wall elongation regulator TseB-like domain-containing protein n=1 Tax=unclassified Paenibacillus TaxID=185978 RepID=UPI001EF476C2|nr:MULTISPECIES: DUF5590 domain-containing protein [unclassified Paenibacillus]MCG7406493.1 DUF5590 domain-containing protein [Paenibacillus sp. ACRRX]MDK8179525.1 DUF5590 domain-containing protein [Paenibacillus sp. UMB4589-SE434]
MARTRARRHSRMRLWILAVSFVIVLLGFLTVRYLMSVNDIEHAREAEIIQRANKAIALKEIIHVDKSVWDTVYYIVTGKDQADAEQMVWVGAKDTDPVTVMKAADGVSKAQVTELLQTEYAGIHIVRVIPGVKANDKGEQTFVWQAQVQRPDENGIKRYFYHFFDFKSGAKLDVYAMPNQ